MRILFLTTRLTKPSYRFRIEQLQPFFVASGHECDTKLIPPSFFDRMALFKTASQYDAVVLQKKLLNRLELGVLFGFCRKLIYDFDDAVMFNSSGESEFRRASRFRNVVRAADLVVCGNKVLMEHVSGINSRVVEIPTPIDTDKFHPSHAEGESATSATCRIGWTGSRSTNGYLNQLFPILAQLNGNLELRILSDSEDGFQFESLGDVPYEFTRWTPDNEITETARFDIGLMPLPDDPWTRGKCGFKALQYMALGIPAVCSPVGVNKEIITDGVNGCLPANPETWISVLNSLIADQSKCREIGEAGRRHVDATYSLNAIGPQYVAAVESVALDNRRVAAA